MARETVTIQGLDSIKRRLMAFPAEMSKRGGPVRAGVRKAAVVIQKEMQANVAAIVSAPNVGGGDQSIGLLEKSIKPVRAKAPKKYKGETFFVLVPKKIRYPVSKRTPSGINVSRVGQMLEYGTSKRKPMPWARPAFHAKKNEAVTAMVTETENGISRIEKKLAATVR